MVVLYNTKAEKENINNFGDFPSIQIITPLAAKKGRTLRKKDLAM